MDTGFHFSSDRDGTGGYFFGGTVLLEFFRNFRTENNLIYTALAVI